MPWHLSSKEAHCGPPATCSQEPKTTAHCAVSKLSCLYCFPCVANATPFARLSHGQRAARPDIVPEHHRDAHCEIDGGVDQHDRVAPPARPLTPQRERDPREYHSAFVEARRPHNWVRDGGRPPRGRWFNRE